MSSSTQNGLCECMDCGSLHWPNRTEPLEDQIAALHVSIDQYKIAVADAIRCPMGIWPDSAQGLLTQDEVASAEVRRAGKSYER